MFCKGKKNSIAGTFFLLFIFQYWGLTALDPGQSIDQYVLDQWKNKEGLASNIIYSISQTPDGYLWIATAGGVMRFDGVKFSPMEYNKSQDSRNRGKAIYYVLFVDREGTLWIGGSRELIKYQYQTHQFTFFTKKNGLKGHSISHVYEDMKGNLWIGFLGGYLNRFTNGKFTRFNVSVSHDTRDSKIISIIEDSSRNLLVATQKNGIFQFKNGKFLKCDIKDAGPKVNKIYKDRNRELWIGTNKGLVHIIDKKNRIYSFRDGLSNENIINIEEDSHGNLWVGTLNGLNRLKKNEPGEIVIEKRLENHLISYLFEDRENNLWIGTAESGLIRLKNAKFITHASANKNQGTIIYAVFEDRQGDTWVGANEGKLLRYRKNEYLETLQIPGKINTNIICIDEDSNGNLWMGSCEDGVFKWERKSNRFINFTTRDGLADNYVISVSHDSKNNLWFSTDNGVSRYSKGVFKSFKNQDGLLGKQVAYTYEDKNHSIWVLNSKGINVLKNGKFTRDNMITYLKGIGVVCIYEEQTSPNNGENVFWFGTYGHGIRRFKDGTFTSYTDKDGLISNYIYQLFADDWGNFWMSSNRGTLRINKNQLDAFAQGQVDRIHCTSFDTSDGMISVHFYNTLSASSAIKTRDGELLFVTKKGITMVHPGKIKVNRIPPPVIIEDFFFKGSERYAYNGLYQETLVFKGMNHIGFHFTAPTFLSPGKIKFKYQLKGHDKDWAFLAPGASRVALYEGLAPRSYIFKVTACSSEGIWNNTGASMAFTINTCFQNSTTFKVLLLLGGLALVAAAVFLSKKFPLARNGKVKYNNSQLDHAYVKECIKKLDYFMEIEKVYRDENISLQSLSKKIAVTPHQLSRILNEKLNKNFPDFINTYRVEEAKNILADPKQADRKILTIAFDVGFNTKVAFNTTFKKHTKMTPSQFKKKVRTSVGQ